MITVIFTVLGMSVGLGMGTVLAKFMVVKRVPYTFRYNNVEYVVSQKKK